MRDVSFDRVSVEFLLALGGAWVSDDQYVSIRQVLGPLRWDGDTEPDYWLIGINDTDPEGGVYYEFWEDLIWKINLVQESSPGVDLVDAIPNTLASIGELWNKHDGLDSALNMIQDILAQPTKYQYGRDWVVDLERSLGI